MLTKEDALQIATNYLNQELCKEYPCRIVDEVTKETEFGWIFFYQSREYLETKDITKALVGNAPLIVSNTTGDITVAGTAYPIDKYIEDYRDGKLK